MNNELITIVTRVPVAAANLESLRFHGYNPNNEYTRPYSLVQGQFYDDKEYVTYPEVIPNEYMVNTEGRIFDINNVEVNQYDSTGYKACRLRVISGGTKPFLAHRIVAYQFCNPPVDYKNRTVNHIDTNKYNNHVNNLEWITVAANNQHAREVLTGGNSFIINKRPVVNERFVRYICEEFVKGKSNTDIMKELGMEINNANHTLFRDIRGGYTWQSVTSQYTFNSSSKKHAYSKEEKEQIKDLLRQGKSDVEIFKIMNGIDYIPSFHRRESIYRTIVTIRISITKK